MIARAASLPLLGRSRELAAVASALDRTAAGRGGVLLVSGEPGIGKTALAEAAAEAAGARGMRALWGRGWEQEAAPALWPWLQALRALGDGTDLPRSDLADAAAADRIAGALARGARATPLLVLLDDLEAGGSAAVRLLPLVAARLTSSPVLILATFRSSVARSAEGVREVLSQLADTYPGVRLEGLEPDAVAALLEALGEAAPPEQVARVHAAAGGNPLLVTLLARTGHAAAPDHEHGPEPPEELRAHVRLQLGTLPPATRELLDVVSVLSSATTIDAVAAVAGSAPAEVRARLAPAEADGILRVEGSHVRFQHAIVRATLYAELPPIARADLHQRAADALRALDHEDARIRAEAAHHGYHAALGGAGEPMLRRLVAAAEDAGEAGAHAEAASLLDHAVDCAEAEGEPAVERGRLLVDLAAAQERAGQHGASERSWQEALALARLSGDAALLARAAVGTTRSGLFLGLATPTHVRALEEALEALGREPSPLCAQVLAHLGSALYWTPERSRGISLTDRAREMAREHGDPPALAAALLASHYVARGPELAAGRAELAREAAAAADASGDADLSVLARSALVVDHRELGDPDGVDAAVADLRRFAAGREHAPGRWAADVHDLVTALLAGDQDRTMQLRRSVVRSARGARDLRYLTEFAEVMTDLRPLTDGARERIDKRTQRLPEVISWRARALLDAVERGEEGTEPELGAIVALLRAPGSTDAHWLLAAALTAEAVAHLGDARRAGFLTDLLRPHAHALVVASRVGACRGAVRYHLGILALTEGEPARALEHLEAAREIHERVGHHAHLPRTRDALARAAALASGAEPRLLGTLTRHGAYWTLQRDEDGHQLPDVKGLRYLAHLIAAPHEPIAALELFRLDATGGGSATRPAIDLWLDGGGADAVLDETAKRAYRARLSEIDRALAAVDGGRTAELEHEREALEAALAGGVGRGGRDRRLPSEAERARTSVTKALRTAVERIRALDPELGAHLDGALRTGQRCTYAPEGARLRVR